MDAFNTLTDMLNNSLLGAKKDIINIHHHFRKLLKTFFEDCDFGIGTESIVIIPNYRGDEYTVLLTNPKTMKSMELFIIKITFNSKKIITEIGIVPSITNSLRYSVVEAKSCLELK